MEETILICGHHAPHVAIKLCRADDPHQCPHVTGNCNCEPIEVTETEYENALRGEWSDRILELCKNQAVES